MADVSFDDLVPQAKAPMAPGGGAVSFDDLVPKKKGASFDDLVPGKAGEMRSYESKSPIRDAIASKLLDMGLPRQTVEGLMGGSGLGHQSTGLVDLFPPASVPLAANESQTAMQQGHPGEAVIKALGVIPAPGAGVAGEAVAAAAPKVVDAVASQLPRAVTGNALMRGAASVLKEVPFPFVQNPIQKASGAALDKAFNGGLDVPPDQLNRLADMSKSKLEEIPYLGGMVRYMAHSTPGRIAHLMIHPATAMASMVPEAGAYAAAKFLSTPSGVTGRAASKLADVLSQKVGVAPEAAASGDAWQQFLSGKTGDQKFIVAPRLTQDMRDKGYELAIPQDTFNTWDKEFAYQQGRKAEGLPTLGKYDVGSVRQLPEQSYGDTMYKIQDANGQWARHDGFLPQGGVATTFQKDESLGNLFTKQDAEDIAGRMKSNGRKPTIVKYERGVPKPERALNVSEPEHRVSKIARTMATPLMLQESNNLGGR